MGKHRASERMLAFSVFTHFINIYTLINWFTLAVLASIIAATRKGYEKDLTKVFGDFGMGFIIKLFSILPLLALCLYAPIPKDILHLPWAFWWPLLVIWAVLYPIQTLLYYRAMREGELSHVMPIVCVWPVLNAITSLFIGETPSFTGWVGMVCITIGTILLIMHKHESEEKEKKFRRAALNMLAATCCFAVGSSLDKVAMNSVKNSSTFYTLINSLGATLVFIILIPLFKEKYHFNEIRSRFWGLTVIGILFAISFALAMAAFSMGPTSYSLSVRSIIGLLIPAAIGVHKFDEKITTAKKVAFSLFIAGIVLMTVLH